ncbi:RagB/SusD family nutrient uptake outer membrane protein [Sphingobacterium corticis]|uniref:RagB/SusD family nutrient uptake outer membrane protein n=1 Tax=Sphingobacterium corticis TaxID=1812823 RepID=A0ABW5NMP9_9SPHI
MKRNFIFITILSAALFTTSACRKYVELDLIGQRELKYTEDYKALLNYRVDMEPNLYFPVLASDDVYSADDSYLNRFMAIDANAYTWAGDIVGDNQEDPDWQKLYKQIYITNQIIAEAPDSRGGSELEKKQIVAQAKVHRATAYYFLVNTYAKQYNPASAGTDLGVPVLTKPDLFAKLDRMPVQGVYDQIISDLTTAMVDLPEMTQVNTLPSATAAKAMLARTYLQMENYPLALQHANEVLAVQNKLTDLQLFVNSPNTYPSLTRDTEEIFIKTTRNTYPTLALNPELLNLFEANDLRRTLFVVEGAAFGTWQSFNGFGYNKLRIISQNQALTNGPTVPEMMLIKAEALVRNAATFAEGIAVINELRKFRFETADYQPFVAANQAEALKLVINERRKELMAKGLRWFDQKRLASEPGFVTTQTRTYKGVTYTLEPNSPRYVMPIATKYIVLNPEIIQNPR